MMDNSERKKADAISDMRDTLGKFDDDKLKKIAEEGNIDLSECDGIREDIIFKIADESWKQMEAERQAEIEREKKAEETAKREAFYQTKEGKKKRAIDELAARDNAVRAVNNGFVRALPSAARMQGTHQPSPDAAGDHAVPDGRYRVSGSFWVMTFADCKWISADMAHARGEPDWIDIPDMPGNVISAPVKGGKSG
jgi:hypothetical protein